MKYEAEAKQIVKLVGGEKNVNSLVHCVTRLRFDLKDIEKTDKEALSALPYVQKVIISGGQYQVVIGQAVDDYFDAILATTSIGKKKAEGGGKKGTPLDRVMKVISGAFSPLIPAMAGAGMIKAVLTILIEFGIMGYDNPTYLILSAAGNSVFYFMPIFLGCTLATQLGANMFVGGAIGAALMEPNFTGLLNTEGVNFLGIGVTPIDYGATIFPIFIAMLVYALLDKGLRKIIKKELQLFLVPMLSLMIMVPFTVIVFGPVGTTFGNAVADAVVWLFDFNRLIAGAVLGALYPFLTILGLHWGFTPITLQNIEMFGGDVIEGVCVCAVWAQIGIAVGAYLKSKKGSKMRTIAAPNALTGFLAGVTEPILYGIVMEYKRLFPVVAIASGLGGAVNGLFHVTYDVYVFHNVFALATMCYSPMFACLIGIAVAFAAGLLLTYFWGIREEDMKDFLPEEKPEPVKIMNHLSDENGETEDITICSPASGEIVPLEKVEDEVFSSGIAGQGVAIRLTEGTVCAPCNGTVTAVFPTKHAVGIVTNEGAEMIVHIGINTVMLEGEGFETFVEVGDKVQAGQKMVQVDTELLTTKGYSLVTPVLITNFDNYQEITDIAEGQIQTGAELYCVKR